MDHTTQEFLNSILSGARSLPSPAGEWRNVQVTTEHATYVVKARQVAKPGQVGRWDDDWQVAEYSQVD